MNCMFRHQPVPFKEMIKIFFDKHPLTSPHIDLVRGNIEILRQFNPTIVAVATEELDRLQKTLDEQTTCHIYS